MCVVTQVEGLNKLRPWFQMVLNGSREEEDQWRLPTHTKGLPFSSPWAPSLKRATRAAFQTQEMPAGWLTGIQELKVCISPSATSPQHSAPLSDSELLRNSQTKDHRAPRKQEHKWAKREKNHSGSQERRERSLSAETHKKENTALLSALSCQWNAVSWDFEGYTAKQRSHHLYLCLEPRLWVGLSWL